MNFPLGTALAVIRIMGAFIAGFRLFLDILQFQCLFFTQIL
jgi:hypothetical protein